MRKYNAYKQPTFAAVISYIAYGSASFFTFLQPPGHQGIYHEGSYKAACAQVQTGMEILFHAMWRFCCRCSQRQTLPVSDPVYCCPYARRPWLYGNCLLLQSTDSFLNVTFNPFFLCLSLFTSSAVLLSSPSFSTRSDN